MPWTSIVDTAVTKESATLTTAGFSVAALKTGKDLAAEEAAVKKAASAAKALRGKIKDANALGKQRHDVEKSVEGLRPLLEKPATPAVKDLADDALVKELDALLAAAALRLGGYGSARWYNRMHTLRGKLDDPAWLFGSSKELKVSDPPPAQLVEHGYFTLKPTAKFKSEAFELPFVRAMVKHGFTHGGTWSTPDFMHFELRWKGPGS